MTGKASPRAQAGVTLMEVLISLVVIIIGLLGLMKVASVAVQSNTKGLRISHASDKAQARLESLKEVPTATLACLDNGSSPSSCLSSCTAAGGDQKACALALGLTQADPGSGVPYGDDADSTKTQYTYGFLVNAVTANIYDIQVVVSFIDDSADPPKPVRVVLRTAVYR